MILHTQFQGRLAVLTTLTAVLALGVSIGSAVDTVDKVHAQVTTVSTVSHTSPSSQPEAVSPYNLSKTQLPLASYADSQVAGAQAAFASVSVRNPKANSTQAANTKTPKEVHINAQKRAQHTDGDTPVMTATDKREILWLARILYSETKRAHEQRLVAWVVRNRVDTGYTGRTYERVANHSAQFSGLQPFDPRYEHNMSRWWESSGESWKSALAIAKEVYFAPESERPFSVTTRHFYSPVAVSKPAWAKGREAVRVVRGTRHTQPRFAFYAQVR